MSIQQKTTTTYHYVPWQVDAVGHGADLFEGVEHGPVRAAHGPPVLVLGITKFIKTSGTSSLQWKSSGRKSQDDEDEDSVLLQKETR